MTHYDTLNLKPDASESEIKNSFRKLAAKYHPDKNAGNKQSEEKFKQINEAYQVLSDKEGKRMYDAALKRGSQGFNGTYGGSPFDGMGANNANMDDFIKNTFKTYRSNNNYDTSKNRGFGGFEDLFNFAKNQNTAPTINLNLTFWEAALGCKKLVYIPESILPGNIKTNIKIEPATDDGTILSVKVKGVEFEVNVRVKNDSNNFTREKLNLYTSVDVPFTTALLGGKITFPHWTKDVEVTIPESSKNGTTLRLKQLGINKAGEQGHLFLKINIIMPEKLTKRQKELLQEFNEIESTKK